MRLQRRTITYHDFDISANALLTLSEAAEVLGIKMSGMLGLIDRATLTQIIDADARERGRRYSTQFVLREEVEELARQRKAQPN